jgi:hypothetical protein
MVISVPGWLSFFTLSFLDYSEFLWDAVALPKIVRKIAENEDMHGISALLKMMH